MTEDRCRRTRVRCLPSDMLHYIMIIRMHFQDSSSLLATSVQPSTSIAIIRYNGWD